MPVFRLFCMLIFFALAGCGAQSNKENTDNQSNSETPVINTPQSRKETVLWNSDKTLQLELASKQTPGDPATLFDLKVIRSKDREVILDTVFRGAAVKWHDTTSIALVPYVGIVPKEDAPDDAAEVIQPKIISLEQRY